MSGAPLRVHRLVRDGMVVFLDAEDRVFARGYVAVDNSRIVDVGPMATCPYRADAEVDASDCLVLPGLVNSHGHLVQSLFRGLGDEMASSAWLDGMVFPLSRALTRDRAYHGARLALLELIRSGVTTTADCHFTHIHPDSIDGVVEAVRESTRRSVVVHGAPWMVTVPHRRHRQPGEGAEGGAAGLRADHGDLPVVRGAHAGLLT